LDNKGKEIPGSKGAESREYINLLFKLEDEMKDLTYNEKRDKRQDASRSILDAFWTWVNETAALSTTNEKLTKALTYATNQRLFADTPKGATANAGLYTLVESAKANELDVYEYLKYLLNEMPNKDFNNHPEILDQYLPWSTELPDECRLTHRHKKCLEK